jgi:hypothetical protein
MDHRNSICNSSFKSESHAAGGTLVAADPHNADGRYLAAATDHADLERRMRTLDRANCAPLFVTFNH